MSVIFVTKNDMGVVAEMADESGFSEEHDAILRAVQGHTQQVRSMRSGMERVTSKARATD